MAARELEEFYYINIYFYCQGSGGIVARVLFMTKFKKTYNIHNISYKVTTIVTGASKDKGITDLKWPMS